MHPRPEKPDNLSTPGLCWRPRKSQWVASWIARPDIVKRGYEIRTRRLWPADGVTAIEPTPAEWLDIASRCATLQSEMLTWANGKPATWDPRAVYDRTFGSLIDIYQRDPDSPYREVRYRTRLRYDSMLRTLKAAVGPAIVPALTFRDFKRWYEKFELPKVEGGPLRKSRAHACLTFTRMVTGFGALLKLPGCKEVKETLDGMEFSGVKKRKERLTARQVIAIRAEAHRVGLPSIALAQAVMFELTMRPKDVLGEHLPLSEPGMSEVIHAGEKWLHGAHWKEVDANLLWEHRLSKSLRGRRATLDPSAGKLETFDLKSYPMIMEELAHIPPERRVGPMIIFERTGRPWDPKYFAAIWREIATAAGVPTNVQNRDSRAGGITEGRKAGASLEDMRHHAGHSQISTTAGYDRGDVDDKNKVAHLRVKDRSRTP